MSKRFGPPRLRGSTQEKSPSEIFRFGYRKGANDKMVPDPVGSADSLALLDVPSKVIDIDHCFGEVLWCLLREIVPNPAFDGAVLNPRSG